jgi:hypothetical protein
MIFTFDLEIGRRVHLENRGTQTLVTICSNGVRQQQQSSSSFQSGQWISSPEITNTSDGIEIKIITSKSQHCIQIQGNSIGLKSRASASSHSQQTLSSFSMISRKTKSDRRFYH